MWFDMVIYCWQSDPDCLWENVFLNDVAMENDDAYVKGAKILP